MLGRQGAQGKEHASGHPAITDSQTGLANGLHFELVYSYLFTAGTRGLTFTVMLLSIGGPDAIPEQRLRKVGQRIRSTTRDSDLVAYVGEGRYVVLLLGTNLSGARVAADRVESAVTRERPVSLGLAAYSPTIQDSSQLLEAADKALLAAEAAGGGVEVA
jgi:diguanylate cyclase (GGDEF)-like protein